MREGGSKFQFIVLIEDVLELLQCVIAAADHNALLTSLTAAAARAAAPLQ
jgi:hypothetical protein